MHAADTNILVRYLRDDDPAQSAKAKAFVEANSVFISATVILETEWVLRSAYRLDQVEIATKLRALAGLPNVVVSQPDVIATALDWAEQGIDFADALHMSAARHCTAFVTFDKGLAKAARSLSDLPVRAP